MYRFARVRMLYLVGRLVNSDEIFSLSFKATPLQPQGMDGSAPLTPLLRQPIFSMVHLRYHHAIFGSRTRLRLSVSFISTSHNYRNEERRKHTRSYSTPAVRKKPKDQALNLADEIDRQSFIADARRHSKETAGI